MNDGGRRSEVDDVRRPDSVRNEFDVLADVVDGGVVRVGADGRIVDVNSAFRDLVPVGDDSVVGESLSTVFGDGTASLLRETLDDGRDGRLDRPVLVEAPTGRGRQYDVDVRTVSGADGSGGVVVLREPPSDESLANQSTGRDEPGGGSSSGSDVGGSDVGGSDPGGNDPGGNDPDGPTEWSGGQAKVLSQLYEFATQSGAPLQERVRGVLSVLRDVAGTEYGTLSLVEGDTYVFEVVDGAADGDVSEGDTVALSETNCERVVEQEDTLVLQDLESDAPELVARAGNQALGLSCYLGAPVILDGEVYGTVCVYGSDTCEFSEWVVSLVEVAAALVEYELEQERAKEGLREERELAETTRRRYETLVENFPDGWVGLFDDDLEYKAIGGDLLDTLDIEPKDRVGNKVFERYRQEVTEELEPKLRTTLDGEPTSFELEIQGRHLSGNVIPIRNADGSVDTGMVVVQDVTERWENRRRLEESEQRYRTLFESMDEGFCTFEVLFEEDDEPVDYRFIETNPAFEELTGLTDAEGERMRELEPGHEEHWFETYGRVALTGEPERFTGRAAQLDDRLYDLYAFRIGEPAERKVAVLFDDITERKETEEKLRESEERFRAFVEASSDVVYRMSSDWNEMYRLEGREFLPDTDQPSDSWLDTYIHPDDQQSVTEAIEEAIQSKTTFEKEHRVRRDDGTLGWTLSRAVPILDADGEIAEWFGTATDVTERKEREQFLEDAKAQMEAAAEAGAVGTWEWHVPEDRFVAGASFARTFDLDPDAARYGVSIERLLSSIHEADRERVEAKIDDTIETCGDIEIEYRVWNADDELRWVVARGHVECDEDGNPVTFPGALTDITDRKRIQQELARQRKQLETLVDMLPVAVFMAERDGEVVEWNEAAEEIWGGEVVESESVAEYEAYDGWWAETGEPLEPQDWPIARALEGEEVTEPDVIEIEGFDGERRMVLNHATPVRDEDGEVSRAIITLVDVTERREYRRKLEESNERLEQFAYAASHDLQEPLRMISSYLSLIESRYDDVLDEDGREFIGFAVDGADRMQEMIDALLEYSRVETEGKDFEPVDLDTVVADVRQGYELKIEERDADVTVESLPTVFGDEDQLRQVVGNLLSNAIEYSGDEPPAVEISAHRDGDSWVVAVADDGIGIDPDHADRVFEVFQRLHSHDEHSGTGIGLALCKRIVERHGGDIWVDSKPGDGSTFYLSIPNEGPADD